MMNNILTRKVLTEKSSLFERYSNVDDVPWIMWIKVAEELNFEILASKGNLNNGIIVLEFVIEKIISPMLKMRNYNITYVPYAITTTKHPNIRPTTMIRPAHHLIEFAGINRKIKSLKVERETLVDLSDIYSYIGLKYNIEYILNGK